MNFTINFLLLPLLSKFRIESMIQRHQYTNRLVHEKSPYLLQHAHNPVDWYPWGEKAFAAAKEQDKPIFLSIGYATCHWCHIMEKESFEDIEVAELLNETFINIKVDREELPEIDSLYMEFAQSMMIGAAGWPLNIILTPNLQPFFAATYMPSRTSQGMMGLIDLAHRILEVWEGGERERIIIQAEKIVEVFSESVHTKGDQLPDKSQINDTIEFLFKMVDPVYGGMKSVPKFPIPYQMNLLMTYSSTANESRGLFIAEKTLDMINRGGIYDHLGGGFSRYSVDEQWLVPHFEKMLYDNALLIHAYLEAWRLTKKNLYKQVCFETCDYILKEMTHPEGGFYSAQDADSEGHEGLFYIWTLEEVKSLLGEKESNLFCEFFDITEAGNFEGRNILHTQERIEEFAMKRGLDRVNFEKKIMYQKHLLLEERKKRVEPIKDDKVLSSWNGLMIHAMVEAGCALQEPKYREAGVKAARFIKERLWKEGCLLRRWRDGEANFQGGLDEYAFLIRGVLTLFEAGYGVEWLDWALEMTQILSFKYKAIEGGFYQTDGLDSSIILRKCQFSDGAEPSGNAIHCENLLRLYQFICDPIFLQEAEDILRAVKKYFDTYPTGYSYHIMNMIRYFDRKAPTIVIALNHKRELEDQIKEALFSHFIPHKAIIWRGEKDQELFNFLPFVREQPPHNKKTTFYICHNGVCEKPLTDLEDIKRAIQNIR
jgi:uncharacterized protein YyaL (SSP411 family)